MKTATAESQTTSAPALPGGFVERTILTRIFSYHDAENPGAHRILKGH
jgi:hypothetical protein